ncbi:MAG: TolC family protein [Deltaproteobacteria bacterium]|nr:TolC family protein [Deltaproteobacteria bacterium]
MNRPASMILKMVVLLIVGCVSSAWGEETAKRLSLAEAVNMALVHNPDIHLARHQEESAAVSVERARGIFQPSLQAAAQARENYLQKAASGGSENFETGNFSFSSALNLFNGFGDTAGLVASRQELGAATKTLKREQQTIAVAAASEFLVVLVDQKLEEAAAENLASQEKLLEQIRAFFQAGSRPVTDLYRQQAETSQAELDLLNVRRNLEVDTLTLLNTMGQAPAMPMEIVPPVELELGEALTGTSLHESYRQALILRPDLLARQDEIASTQERVREARAGYFPSVDLVANAGSDYNSFSSDRNFSSQLFEDNGSGMIGISVSIPIFDRDQTRTSVALAKIRQTDAITTLAKIRQQIGLEVGQALADYRTARKQLEVAKARLTYSTQAYEAAQARYKVGAASWVELSEAWSALVTARNDEIKARYQVSQQGLAVGYARGDLEQVLAHMSHGEIDL